MYGKYGIQNTRHSGAKMRYFSVRVSFFKDVERDRIKIILPRAQDQGARFERR